MAMIAISLCAVDDYIDSLIHWTEFRNGMGKKDGILDLKIERNAANDLLQKRYFIAMAIHDLFCV